MGVNADGLRQRLDGHRILLDTSVLIAYLNAADPAHAAVAFLIGDLVRNGIDPAVVSPVSVNCVSHMRRQVFAQRTASRRLMRS